MRMPRWYYTPMVRHISILGSCHHNPALIIQPLDVQHLLTLLHRDGEVAALKLRFAYSNLGVESGKLLTEMLSYSPHLTLHILVALENHFRLFQQALYPNPDSSIYRNVPFVVVDGGG